jgi:hypothetical protein
MVGVPYFVRVRSHNSVGWSEYSAPPLPQLDSVPQQAPSGIEDGSVRLHSLQASADQSISVSESQSSLEVSWMAPTSTFGSPITSYLIEWYISFLFLS